jgi:hypothetical protein
MRKFKILKTIFQLRLGKFLKLLASTLDFWADYLLTYGISRMARYGTEKELNEALQFCLGKDFVAQAQAKARKPPNKQDPLYLIKAPKGKM